MKLTVLSSSAAQTADMGKSIGEMLRGGECIELKSDLGGGKTTFVSGLSAGFGSSDYVSSPSYTISYVYSRKDYKQLYHFDFYRLEDAGIISKELEEVKNDSSAVVVVEWGEIVHNVLPNQRIVITIEVVSDNKRRISFEYPESYKYLFVNLENNNA